MAVVPIYCIFAYVQVALDIQEAANPIISDTKYVSDTGNVMQSVPKDTAKQLAKHLDTFILIIEGFHNHVDGLAKAEAISLLKDTREIISTYDKLDEKLASIHYLDNENIKAKFKYLLRMLYRLEALLHVTSTKDIPVEATAGYIKASLAKMSNEAIANSISHT